MIRDMMSRHIAIYLAISHTPDPLEKPGTNPNSTKTHHLVAVYSCFFRLCLCPHLGCVRQAFFTVLLLSISWTHHKTDRITSKQQPWAPGLGLLPERMHVCFCFIFLFFSLLFFLSLSFFLLDTWYIYLVLLILAARHLIYYCCYRTRACHVVIVIPCSRDI